MVDPRGLAVFEYDVSLPSVAPQIDGRVLRNLQGTLYTLADLTDGRAIINRNDVLPGLAQIVRDQSAYYLLGYTSSDAPTDGEFHEIEVRVARADVNIRHRRGYYALTEENVARVLRHGNRTRRRRWTGRWRPWPNRHAAGWSGPGSARGAATTARRR